jgi:hypothetical protein
MNVFADFHHAGLLQSLILLFEKRMHGCVYRPIGLEWADEGFWHVYDHPATRQQYLGINGATPDGTPPLNDVVVQSEAYNGIKTNGVFLCRDISSEETNKAITLDAFKRIPIDFVVASIPQHIEPYWRLIKLYKPQAKLLYQIGNAWNISDQEALCLDGVMASALIEWNGNKIGRNGKPLPMVEYHQEFDLEVFDYSRPRKSYDITSMVNCFDTAHVFNYDWLTFQAVEKLMPHWSFKVYGGGCRDGAKSGNEAVAQAIKNSRFIWHTKQGGDGYGHIIHNAFAMGRPPIVKMSQYKNKLMIDGMTCIDIDGLNPQEIVNKILFYNTDERYFEMSRNARIMFDELVNFDIEAKTIKHFLEVLQ